MRIDLSCCGFKNCRHNFDGNCTSPSKQEKCEYWYLLHKELSSVESEPSRDVVDRATMLETYADLYDMFDSYPNICNDIHVVYDKLRNLPSAKPERKKGKWVVTNEFDDCCYAKCNQCNVTQIFYYGKPLTNYCPNCGSYNGG